MSKFISILVSAFLVVSASSVFAANGKGNGGNGNGDKKVEILHEPGPGGANVYIVISENALQAHLDHGDCVVDDDPEEGNGGSEQEDPACLPGSQPE